MGNNYSKPCCGVLERESRRAYQDKIQQLFRMQQALAMPPDVPQEETHIYCQEDEVDQYLDEVNTRPIVLHLKVGNVPEIKDSSLDDSEKLGAAEGSAAVLKVEPGVLKVEPGGDATEKLEGGGDATEKLEAGGDVTVRSEPKGGIVLGTGALPPELDRTLTSMCQQVFKKITDLQKSLRDASETTKGHATLEDLSPSILESQPSILSSGTQTRSPSFGTELQTGRDVHHSHDDAFLENAGKAVCRTVLELATGDMLGAGTKPTSGLMKLEHASSEETLVDTDDTLSSDLDTTETADECSNVKINLETKEAAKILLNLSGDPPRAASKPLPILNKRERKVPGDDYDGENVDARLPKRTQRGMSATVDSEDETEQPLVMKIVRTRQSHWRCIPTLSKKTDVFVASKAEDLHSLPKDEAISAPKENQRQKLVAQNTEARPPTGVAEMTGAVSPPSALLETSEIEQGGPLSSFSQSTAQVSTNAQLPPKSLSVSHPTMKDSSPDQKY